MGRTAASVLLRLSDSLFLPLHVGDYSETLHSFLNAAQRDLGTLLEQHGISLGEHTPTRKFRTPYPQTGLNRMFLTQIPW